MWGFLTADTDSDAAKEYYQRAETSLREALGKNKNYRSARTYLVAVLSELGRQQEAVNEMVTYRNMGGRAGERILPYKDAAIKRRLIELLQAAERGAATAPPPSPRTDTAR